MGTEFHGSRDALPVSFYLMKAEPDSRVVKGRDVKFSVEDFEHVHTTAWEGVRNYEARNIMQEMKVGDKVLFYHSNTKNPGVAGYAEVSKEAYPDYTAWDESHPYYDAKTNPESPKWHMVELQFVSRVPHFVSLALLRQLSTLHEVPTEMAYLDSEDLDGIKNMALLNKGRLSVQRVEKGAWDAISKIANEGYDNIVLKGPKKAKGITKGKRKRATKSRTPKDETEEDPMEEEDGRTATKDKKGGKKVAKEAMDEADERRKSKRAKR